MKQNTTTGEFVFEPGKAKPIGSALYSEHLKLTKHIADFAGYLMPLWYSSISAEHNAVRQAAGLFDCTHMGVFEVAGGQAAGFLNTVCTNDVGKLEPGKAQYSYILDAAGNVLDDIIIYQTADDKYMVVVNAANERKIETYFRNLLNNELIIDADRPKKRLEYKPSIRNIKKSDTDDCGVDIALQGPASLDILSELSEDSEKIENLKPFKLIRASAAGIDCIISRTGYTGAKVCFELFVHPKKAPQLWNKLLESGESRGLLPCGLGARDSLRIEGGLPLYGHELAGAFNISPFEAGYGWAVKLQKDFFIGKAPMEKIAETFDMKVARIELPGSKGIRPVRQNDGVLNSDGDCIGWVLSCAKAGEKQIALAYVDKNCIEENTQTGIYYLARSRSQIKKGKKEKIEKGQNVDADITGIGVSRFEKF